MNLIKTKSFELAIYSQGNPDSEKLALVIPGKLDTKDYAHMRSHVDFLSGLGFYAVSFDPPGTWESTGHDYRKYPEMIQKVNKIVDKFLIKYKFKNLQ